MHFELNAYHSYVTLAEVAHELHDRKDMFGANRIRQFPGSPHHQVDDILLRGPDLDQGLVEIHNDLRCDWYDEAHALPSCRVLTEDLMHAVGGRELGRVIITRLPSGASIEPHIDEGDAAAYYRRYHYCVQGEPGNTFIIGHHAQQMKSGEFWRVNTRLMHSVINNSFNDRIHIVIDIK